jgi:hypothetical protein
MAKATRVHSTPRRTASKIKTKPTESNEQRDLRHSEAFRDLEQPIREVWCLAEMAAEAAVGIAPGAKNEILHFAVYRLCEMVRDLRTKYLADWPAGKAVQS